MGRFGFVGQRGGVRVRVLELSLTTGKYSDPLTKYIPISVGWCYVQSSQRKKSVELIGSN